MSTVLKLWTIACLAFTLTMCAYFALAQQTQRYTQVPGYLVLTACGTGAPASVYKAGSYATGTVDVTGKFCVNQ